MVKTPKQITGYHFTGDKLRNGDPIPKIGVWLKHRGKIKPCKSGLHASKHPFDALYYAPGNLLHKVVLRGGLKSHGDPIDKWVGRERKILATVNAEKLLRGFARWCGLSVIHLWAAPQVVKDYLKTGDEELRDAAWVAAWDATWAATQAAARDAAWVAAWAATRDAAWAATRAATRDAARVAAWDAAWDAAREKQREEFSKLVNQTFKTLEEK